MDSGIKILAETMGTGHAAERGDRVTFESQGYLSRGECIQARGSTTTQLGKRQLIAGIEYALVGMTVGGYCKVKISSHLAYREEGVVGKIPPNAMLIYELWMTNVEKAPCPTRDE